MSLGLTFEKLWTLFLRDLAIARSYRSAFLLELCETLFGVATFYYLSRFVESPHLSSALPQGGSYFAFALIGVAFFDYLGVAFSALDGSLEEARQNRTLEALLVTQTSLPVLLFGSVLYPFVLTSLRTVVYLAWGVLLFGFSPRSANWGGAILILLSSILAFAGLGVFSTSYSLLFKRGNPAKWILLGLSGFLGGMMYPVSVLPGYLQDVARLIPITYSLEGMRAALLGGASFRTLCPSIIALLVFAAILLPLSFLTFAWALRRTKITGTLTHI
ncbi:MAG TPA: ABC transporter permease [Candidatus Acidoferrales bacterium]|nr:ABC transporter permease [Candidatus Acidoferrales bacterium]